MLYLYLKGAVVLTLVAKWILPEANLVGTQTIATLLAKYEAFYVRSATCFLVTLMTALSDLEELLIICVNSTVLHNLDTYEGNMRLIDYTDHRVVSEYLEEQLWLAKEKRDLSMVMKLDRVLIAFDTMVDLLSEEENDE